jgi:hypothetical protein
MSTDVSEVRAASIIALIMEAARTSETSVDIQLKTRQYTPEDSEIHTTSTVYKYIKEHVISKRAVVIASTRLGTLCL